MIFCATPLSGSTSDLESQERLVRPSSSSPSAASTTATTTTGCLRVGNGGTTGGRKRSGSSSASSDNDEECETRSCISNHNFSNGNYSRGEDVSSQIEAEPCGTEMRQIELKYEPTQHGEFELVEMRQPSQQVVDPSQAPSLSTPDLLYHHHHVSHATLPHPSHQNQFQMNHASAAATLNRYTQFREVTFQQQQFRYSFGNEFMLGETQLGGNAGFEPMLATTTIQNPDTLDGIIGPSAAATFIRENGRGLDDSIGGSEVNCLCCGGRCLVPRSVVSKLNKLSPRSGIYKFLGDFSLRENIYYGLIFIVVTIVVLVCFLILNNRFGWGFGSVSGGTAAAFYDLDKQCDTLHDPVHGEVHQTGRYLGDRAIYTCIPGFEIVGAEERVCQANGDWSNQEPFCKKRVYCTDPPLVQHATHNAAPDMNTFPLETVLKYACYPGYLTVGFAHAKCFLYNDTAQWFGPDITCKAIRCSEPEEIPNGDVDRKCQTFGCRISYTCRPGYELVGRQHRYCQADGSWSPRILPECVPIQCATPTNPENGRAVFASVSYNSLISYECNYGYMLVGDQVRRCERNKEWTGTEPACKEINCGSPGILPNGWLEGSRTTLHAVVTFRCQEGMTFEGPSYRTICQADGRWSHPLPRCYAPCVVPHISHGFVADRAVGSSVPHTHTIEVGCLSQFQKTHNSTPVCKNGTWSRIPKCVPAKCTELPEAPQNGMVVAPNLDHGMVGKFECRDGYMLKGHNTTQCFFGNWTGMTPWCKEVFCPFPGFIENGKVLLVGSVGLYEYRPYVRKIRNNRQIMFQCDRGYVLVGGPTGATCIDGSWSPPQLPRCQEEAHPKARFAKSTQRVILPNEVTTDNPFGLEYDSSSTDDHKGIDGEWRSEEIRGGAI